MRDVRRSIKGFGLVEILVVASLVGILMAGLSGMFNFAFKSQTMLTGRVDREQIRQHFSRTVNCTDSLPGGTCTAGTLVTMRAGALVLAANSGAGTKYGAWTARGECSPTGNGVLLRAVRLKPTGNLLSTNPNDFELDPLTKTPITWTDPRSLLQPAGIMTCGSSDIENRIAALETLATAQAAEITTLKAQVLALQNQLNAVQLVVNNMRNNTCANVPKRPIGGFDAAGSQQCAPVAGDYNGDGYPDFASGVWPGAIPTGAPPYWAFTAGAPHIKVYSGAAIAGGNPSLLASFYAYSTGFVGGTSVALVDVTGDGLADIMTGAGPGGNAHIKMFRSPVLGGGRTTQ